MMTNSSKESQLALFPLRTTPSDFEIRNLLARAHEMRSDVIANMINSFFGAIKQRLQIARNMRALSDLSDSVLADIGIDRSQIPAISQALAEGKSARSTVATVDAPLATAETHNAAVHQHELPLAA